MDSESQKGRGADTDKLNREVIPWLIEDMAWTKRSKPPFAKAKRGFNDEVTARYLLPIEWVDEFDADPQA